jgi:hypothetical protein
MRLSAKGPHLRHVREWFARLERSGPAPTDVAPMNGKSLTANGVAGSMAKGECSRSDAGDTGCGRAGE